MHTENQCCRTWRVADVVASISCSLKRFPYFSAIPFQKATFPSAFQVPKLCQTTTPFQTATFAVPVKKLVWVKPRLRCKWRLFSAFQTARPIQTPKLFQVTITNDWLKPDSLSSCDKYWQQRRRIHAGRALKHFRCYNEMLPDLRVSGVMLSFFSVLTERKNWQF